MKSFMLMIGSLTLEEVLNQGAGKGDQLPPTPAAAEWTGSASPHKPVIKCNIVTCAFTNHNGVFL